MRTEESTTRFDQGKRFVQLDKKSRFTILCTLDTPVPATKRDGRLAARAAASLVYDANL